MSDLRPGFRFGEPGATAVGDVNGDGVGDVAVNAYSLDNGEDGYVEILSGRDGETVTRLVGEVRRDRFGESLAAIGDLNGDGVSEIAVGATSPTDHQHPGYVYVISLGPGKIEALPEITVSRRAESTLLSWPTDMGTVQLEQSCDLRRWEAVELEQPGIYRVPDAEPIGAVTRYFRLRVPG